MRQAGGQSANPQRSRYNVGDGVQGSGHCRGRRQLEVHPLVDRDHLVGVDEHPVLVMVKVKEF